MLPKLRAWWSIEGFWFWSILVVLVVVYTAPVIHMEWLVRPGNGFWRLKVNLEVALLHGSLAFCVLLLMLCTGKAVAVLLRVLGLVAVVAGFHTLWWLGPVPTVIPLVWGGGRIGLARSGRMR